MRNIFLILLLALFVFPINAEVYEHKTTLKNVLLKIPELESIKCKFRQEKTLKNIQKPLISNGNFEFKKGEGVFFETVYPVKSNINYTNQNYKQINDIIGAISEKKYSKLEKEFDFYFEENNSDWILGLKPKDKNISEFLSEITIEGQDYIKKIEINQTNGNETKLWFIK